MKSSIVALLMAAPMCAAMAAQVGEALQRPALMVRQPERSVLLAAAQAGEHIVAVGERGVVVLSDDNGRQWHQVPCPVSVTLTMVRFADPLHGVAVGHGGTVLTTDDGGNSWRVSLDGRRLARIAKDAATSAQAQKEAERLVADGADKPFLDVLVWDAKRMLVVGAYGLAFHTIDGGVTWMPWMARLPNPKGLHWYVARRSGDAVLLAGEQGLIARSGDGGESFKAITSPYKGSWFAGEMNDGQLLLAGLRGNVWRSADAGVNWQPIASPIPASITASATASDGSVLLASQAGVVMRLRADALVPLNSKPLPMPAGVLPARDGGMLTVGVAGAQAFVPDAGGRP